VKISKEKQKASISEKRAAETKNKILKPKKIEKSESNLVMKRKRKKEKKIKP
jgi:hypothetical protein